MSDNQRMHESHEQWEAVETHINQKVESLIGWHKEECFLEGIQK